MIRAVAIILYFVLAKISPSLTNYIFTDLPPKEGGDNVTYHKALVVFSKREDLPMNINEF